MVQSGLYEQVINKLIASELKQIDKFISIEPIDTAEASKVLSKYLSEMIEKRLENMQDSKEDIEKQISFVNRLVTFIKTETDDITLDSYAIDEPARRLLAVIDKTNSIYSINGKADSIRPETSIAVSSLFTGAIHEPSMFSELKKEILSSDRIDMLVSFIKWSGLRLIIEELRSFTQRGGLLRVITTSYMGATDVKAIAELETLPSTEIKISYDTKRTRLHAKTYVFYRNTGFTTAYVGSSNLSNAAISSGLEWNVKITAKDLPDTLKKIEATYESYWNNDEFEFYNAQQRPRLAMAFKSGKDRLKQRVTISF